MIDFSDSHPSDLTRGQRNQADDDAPASLGSTVSDDDTGYTVRGLFYANLSDALLNRQRADERDAREQKRAEQWLAREVAQNSFRSAEQLVQFACERAVAQLGRSLTSAEHSRITRAARSLHAVSGAVSYELTEAGRALLAAHAS